jgi:Ran GTPase-activating protein (RanGAP) involved in mRNA processing and transport
VLQKNTTLKELNLRNNRIGDEGGKAIGKALEVSPVFRVLFPCSCAVTRLPLLVTHVTSVILVLQENTTLKELDLEDNKIGDEGGKAIGKALEVSFVLVFLLSFR